MTFSSKFKYVACFILLLFANGRTAEVRASNTAAAIAPYVNDDTFLVAYFDLAALAKTDAGKQDDAFAMLPFLQEDAQVVLLLLQGLDSMARSVAAAGADRVYAVAGLADMYEHGGPILVFDVRAGAEAKNVASALTSAIQMLGPFVAGAQVRTAGSHVLVGQATVLDRYANLARGDRNDLSSPLANLSDEGAVLAAVFCPGPDFRRVVRELWPVLPGRFAVIRGELADKWQHVEVAINAPPDSQPRIALLASDAASAELFAQLWRELPEMLRAEVKNPPPNAIEYTKAVTAALPPRVEGRRVEMRFRADESQIEKLQDLAAEATDASLQSTHARHRLDQFRNLSMAFLLYENSKKHYPPAAIRDKAGKPLLSWRVELLPYLGEAELYKQFRLDEPWDSEHNRALVSKMPAAFADPDQKLRQVIGAGKTTYQVPMAPDGIFGKPEGATVRDVTDGTVKTLLIVEVVPEKAVEWTKPADWEVDAKSPMQGVSRDDRRSFTAAFADGHVETIAIDAEPAKVLGLITRDGGEVFDWPR